MKKNVLILITLLSFTFLNAQIELKPGIKGGLNRARLTNLEDSSTRNKGLSGFHIGGTLGIKFARFYTLQPEIMYSQQGSDLIYNGVNSSVNLNYLSLLANNKFYIANSNLNFQIAAFIDILLNHENVEYPQKVDIGAFMAVGFDLPSGVVFSLGFKQGLTDLFGRNVNTYNYDYYETTDLSEIILNQVVQFTVGYQFDL